MCRQPQHASTQRCNQFYNVDMSADMSDMLPSKKGGLTIIFLVGGIKIGIIASTIFNMFQPYLGRVVEITSI